MRTYTTDNDGLLPTIPVANGIQDPMVGVMPSGGVKLALFGRTAAGNWIPILVNADGSLAVSLPGGSGDPNGVVDGAQRKIWVQDDALGTIWVKGTAEGDKTGWASNS